jgi:hypothetical protein
MEIIHRIMHSMRATWVAPDAKKLVGFDFPIIAPDLERLRENEEEQADNGVNRGTWPVMAARMRRAALTAPLAIDLSSMAAVI